MTLSTRLAEKRSGCVVWMVYDPATLVLGPFLWFGGAAGEALPELGTKVARHTKGNAQGQKTAKPGHRVVRKSAFEEIRTMATLADKLFGPSAIHMSAEAALMTDAGPSALEAGTRAA